MHGGEIMNFQVSLLQIVSGGSAFVGGGDLAYIGMVGKQWEGGSE